jgi:hypothetical protein
MHANKHTAFDRKSYVTMRFVEIRFEIQMLFVHHEVHESQAVTQRCAGTQRFGMPPWSALTTFTEYSIATSAAQNTTLGHLIMLYFCGVLVLTLTIPS